jgi:hypothetical protein
MSTGSAPAGAHRGGKLEAANAIRNGKGRHGDDLHLGLLAGGKVACRHRQDVLSLHVQEVSAVAGRHGIVITLECLLLLLRNGHQGAAAGAHAHGAHRGALLQGEAVQGLDGHRLGVAECLGQHRAGGQAAQLHAHPHPRKGHGAQRLTVLAQDHHPHSLSRVSHFRSSSGSNLV